MPRQSPEARRVKQRLSMARIRHRRKHWAYRIPPAVYIVFSDRGVILYSSLRREDAEARKIQALRRDKEHVVVVKMSNPRVMLLSVDASSDK